MPRTGILAQAALLALLSAAAPRPTGAAVALPGPDEAWIEIRSANFTLVSNAAPEAAQSFAADLERLRSALSQIFPGLQLSSPHPTTIYVFKSAASFAPYQRLYNGRPAGVGGYFLSRPYANYVAIGTNPKGDDRALIYHEYLHYVLRNNYPELPLWLNEGLAEYYSTFELAGRGEAKLGLPIQPHLAWLRLHPAMPFRQLLTLDSSSPEYNERERRGGFYAQAWALIHYLMGNSKARKGQLVELLTLLHRGKPAGEAVSTALATPLEALDKELAVYVKGYTFPYLKVPVAAGSDLKIETRPMARHEVLFRLGDLLASLDDALSADAETTLRAALALKPDHGPTLASLAQVVERTGKPEEARALQARAAELSPNDWIVQYRYARNLLEGSEAGSLAAAQKALRRVVDLRPQFGEAWADLGYTYQGKAQLGSDALTALETAHRLLPARRDVAHNLGIAYANNGRLAEAQKVIDEALRSDEKAATSVREAILNQRLRQTDELLQQQKLAEALPLLAEIQKQTTRPDFSASLARQIEEIEGVLAHNRFVAGYNEAVEKVNRGDLKEAAALLEALVAETRDPASARRAKELLARIEEHAGKKRVQRP